MKVALYARVSTEDKGQDPEVQLSILRKTAFERGYEIVGEYVDFASGKDGNRPRFKDMMTAARRHEFDAIMALRIDRIMRSIVNLHTTIENLQNYRVKLIFSDMDIDYETPNGKLMINLIGSIAEWEREMISTRTHEGMAEAKRKGKKFGRKQRDDININQIAMLRTNG